ncbi:TPA: hypothetical protein U2C09_000336 [Streptococcus suis]|nr:hypothetical protein [Streptococcus suis]
MNEYQENQLLTILSDFIPLMGGDIIQGLSPEAKDLTRQKVLEHLKADKELFDKEDTSLVNWQEENIHLLETISDDDFQSVANEKIMITELQIGQSLFQPISDEQLERLAEKLDTQKEKRVKNQLEVDEKDTSKRSFLKHFVNSFR